MINIDGLEFKRYVPEKDKYSKVLPIDFAVQDFNYINNGRNVLKLTDDLNLQLIRFDSINTFSSFSFLESNKTLQDVKTDIINELDYSLKYAEDRTELVDKLIEKNEWIYDFMSTERMIKKENKTKTSFLSENQRFDQLIEQLSSYINHAKFINAKDEMEHSDLIVEKLEIESINKEKKTGEDFGKLDQLTESIRNYHHKITKKHLLNPKTETVGNLANRENLGDFSATEESKQRAKSAKFPYHKGSIPDDYWPRMYSCERQSTIPFYDFDLHNEEFNKSSLPIVSHPEMLKQMESDLLELNKYLGLNLKDKKDKDAHKVKLKAKFERMMLEDKRENTKNISGERQYNILRRMYTELKGNYELSKKILTNEFYFQPAKHSTIYEICSDTWYEDENGEIVELSKNTVQMSNQNTYKGLILNYKDLKDKYQDDQNSDWWALLKDFEEVYNSAIFTKDEQFILDVLLDGYSQTQIQEKYRKYNTLEFPQFKISRLINQQIPAKLAKTYLNNIDEWVYTEKVKGVYKKCNKCGEIKLISNDRYFRKRIDKKGDGYYNSCKNCESDEKVHKKPY